MGRTKQLINNSLIFAIGNLGSKLIGFIMTPFYTAQLTPAEFGTADYLSTLSSLLMPLIAMSVVDAVFRFLMNEDESPKSVLSNAIAVATTTLTLASIVVYGFFNNSHGWLLFGLLVAGTFLNMFQQFARGMGYIKQFASTGIIVSFATVAFNLIFLFMYNGGVNAYLGSMVLAQLLGTLYIATISKAWQYFSIHWLSWGKIRLMLLFSIPLIPNALSWWMSNTASRLFIVSFVGVAANGVFAVANKLPSLISMLYSIFTQAWEITAVSEFKSNDKSEYYSSVFNATGIVLMQFSIILTLLSKPILTIFAAPAYYSAWELIPILSLTVVYSSLSAFLGTTYIAAMKTKSLFMTTWIGAISNLLINVILVPKIGVWGAALGGMISFLLVLVLRLWHTKRFIEVIPQKALFIAFHFGMMISMLVARLADSLIVIYSISIFALLTMLLVDFKYFGRYIDFKKIMQKLVKKGK
ncbi:oligosaccharide flippase family protein [Weissella confusa]